MLHTELFCGLEKNNPGYAIRQAVFVHEQGFDPNLEFDEKDMTAFHVLVFSDSVPVAVGRFFIMEDNVTAYMGRIAVLKEHRGKKVGAYLLRELEQEAKKRGAQFSMLGAQLHAKGFYEKLGYQPFGEEFDDCGKMHIHMRKTL